MRYDVMLQNKDGMYSATVPAIPGLMCRGRTKESTISATRDAIKAFLLSVEWVTIDVPMPEHHPWYTTIDRRSHLYPANKPCVNKRFAPFVRVSV